jgi:hypothetical protein
MSVVQTLVVALVSVGFGAVLSAALQYTKRQHRQELQSLEEREMRRERRRAVERFREVGVLLIEINRGLVSGPNVNQTEVTTMTLIEIHRLRRELLNATAAVRDAFPDQDKRLTPFLRMTEKISPESANRLRDELDAIVAALRADVSISDK